MTPAFQISAFLVLDGPVDESALDTAYRDFTR